MSKIDISNWHKFKIDNLFEKITTKKLPYKATQLPHHATEDNLIPLVTAGVEHQGRSVYAPKTKDITVLSNCLTISANGANSGATFYQDKPFSILQDAYAIQVKSSINENVSKYEYCFLASVIGKRLQQNDWTNKATWNVVKAKEIRLPVTESDEPDWQYMDEYIAKLATQAHTNINLLRQQQKKAPTVNIDRWKEFKLTELFNVKTGAYLSKNQLKPGSIPRVTVSSVNNGIVGSFERCGLSNERLFSNFLSVNFFGNVFYHDSLCSVDMKVHVLEPKHLYSKESMLFLVAVLRRKFVIEGYGTYGNQLSSSKLKMDMVYLPVDASGSPDWQYMDNYISSIQQAQKERVARLTSIVKKISIPVNGYFCY